MICNLILDESGWLGATWFETLEQQDAAIGIATELVEIKHTSYHPTQIDMLRADAAEMGASLDEHEQMLSDWVEAYVPPPPAPGSVPQVVTRRQARRALAIFGVLDLIQPSIDAIPDETARTLAQIDWDDATEFKRGDETLQMLAGALGLSDSQLDDLFILAGEQP